MDEMYIKVQDLELKRIRKYYENKNKDSVTIWDIINDFDETLYENDDLEEQNDILKDNQRPFNAYREYGLNERDFH